MRWFAPFLTVLGFSSLAFAGPNAGGTLIIHDTGHIYTDEGQTCMVGTTPASCQEADVRVDGATSLQIARLVRSTLLSHGQPALG